MGQRRVVITGLGCISPVGNTVAEMWDAVTSGKSGIGPITRFDASAFSTTFAGEVKDFPLEKYIPGKESRHMDTFIHYGMAAGIQAIEDSGLVITDENAGRIGVNIGSGIGGLPMIEQTHGELEKRGPRRISPFCRAVFDHQYDFRFSFYPLWFERAEPVDRHSLFNRFAFHRFWRTYHRLW